MSLKPVAAEPGHDHYDVVIIGGAAVGSSTAWHLAANPAFGGRVLVVERDHAYTQASTALSASCIRHQYSNAINVKLSMFGTEFVRSFRDRMGADPEVPEIALKEIGYLFLAPPGQENVLIENHAVQAACGAATELLTPEQVLARWPFYRMHGVSLASFNGTGEGWFDGYTMMQWLKRKAREAGVEYVANEVTAIQRDGSRVTGVTLKSGTRVACGTIVNASGPRAALTARMAGLDVPVEPRKRCLFVFDCQTPLGAPMPLTIDITGIHCRSEGSYYLAGTVPRPDTAPDFDDFETVHGEFDDEIWPVMAERVPAFEAIKLVRAWAGHYAYNLLDQNAIVGSHPEVANFIYANGFSGHGLQQSPGVGRGVSELIAHGRFTTLDLGELGYERIVSGTPFLEKAII